MKSSSEGRMTKFVGSNPGLTIGGFKSAAALFAPRPAWFVLTMALGLGGCASAPYVLTAVPEAQDNPSYIETSPRSTVIIVESTDPSAPAPEVVVQQASAPRDGWTPEALPATNPFVRFHKWVGNYDCTQGNTEFVLRVADARGSSIRAVFDFMHVPSGASGSYIVTGHFDSETRRVRFEPTSWIMQPADYVMVPMVGDVSNDDSLFAGKIDFRGCGAFTLKPAR
ncbi:MAG TPA: hypothetical protein PK156_29365 [Polyangium sp.]|nr:hypothetical protein [Polyangium sp.]